MIAVGAVWGWSILYHHDHWMLWSIPIILTLASAVRMAALNRHFTHMRMYIQELEKAFNVFGWEHKDKGWTLGAANFALTVVLLVVAVLGLIMRSKLAVKDGEALPSIVYVSSGN